MKRSLVLLMGLSTASAVKAADRPHLDDVRSMAGCYLVDYSYSETEVIDPSYVLDARVYDVSGFEVKELVKVVDEDEASVRLQHFMQASNFAGETMFMMRHHAEIWKAEPSSRYRYLGRVGEADRWEVEALEGGAWVRETTSLDDGLRYQCVGDWLEGHLHPRFECAALAPIPGRETRDMGRRDYNMLERSSSVILYGNAWLERQNNVKTHYSADGSRQLVREVGKIWSARLPDTECAEVEGWASERQPFWDLLAEAWQEALADGEPFTEIKLVDGTTRGAKIEALQEEYYQTVGSNPEHAQIVRTRLAEIIASHRE